MRPNRMLTRFTDAEKRTSEPIRAKYEFTAIKGKQKIVGTSAVVSKKIGVTISRLTWACAKGDKYHGWRFKKREI